MKENRNRQLQILDFPTNSKTRIPHPENTAILFKSLSRKFDIGILCYLKRDTTSNSRAHQTHSEDSLCSNRRKSIRRLIVTLSEFRALSGKSESTILNYCNSIKSFLNFCDKNEIQNTLLDSIESEMAFGKFIAHIIEKINTHKIAKNTAATLQNNLISIFEIYFENSLWGVKYRKIRDNRNLIEHTKAPDEKDIAGAVSWCSAIFEGITTNLLSDKPYPFSIDCRNPITGETESVVFTATRRVRDIESDSARLAGDQSELALRSISELQDHYESKGLNEKQALRYAHQNLNAAKQRLNDANARGSDVRLSHAALASSCFSVLFLSNSGLNLRQMCNLPWSDSQERAIRDATTTRQNFRIIKWRAGGRTVSIQLTLSFMPAFSRYLELRSYILQNFTCDRLLVSLSLQRQPVKLTDAFLERLKKRLAHLRIGFPHINARKWRAAKQDWYIRTEDPITASIAMGHSLLTALTAYSNGSQSSQASEFREFFSGLESTICFDKKKTKSELQNAVGACGDYLNPQPISDALPITPDCNSTEGCLFCDKYRIHADHIDIRKLLSCRHLVRLISNRADSIEAYKQSFGVILKRIEFILDEIRKKNPSLVDEIQYDVDNNGNFDPFWLAKIQQFIELDLI